MVQLGSQNNYFIFIFNLLLNLAKSFYGSSPLWLHHKIDPQKKTQLTFIHTIEFLKGTNLYGKIICLGGPE